MGSMPRIRTAFTRGVVATWSSTVIVGAVLVWLLVEWLVVVALGYPGPMALLAHILAPPPFSTIPDSSLAVGVFGLGGQPLIFPIAAVHALWQSLMMGMAIESVETGSGASRWGAVRGLRAFPTTLAVRVIGLMALLASELLSVLGGSLGIGLLARIGLFVIVAWLFSFAPVIAVSEGRRVLDCLGRSIRAARMPGSGNLTFAVLYVIPVFATLFASPGVSLDVNPAFTAWIFVVGVNLLHTAVLGALAIRYLAIADEVPEAAPRRTSTTQPAKPSSRPSGGRRRR